MKRKFVEVLFNDVVRQPGRASQFVLEYEGETYKVRDSKRKFDGKQCIEYVNPDKRCKVFKICAYCKKKMIKLILEFKEDRVGDFKYLYSRPGSGDCKDGCVEYLEAKEGEVIEDFDCFHSFKLISLEKVFFSHPPPWKCKIEFEVPDQLRVRFGNLEYKNLDTVFYHDKAENPWFRPFKVEYENMHQFFKCENLSFKTDVENPYENRKFEIDFTIPKDDAMKKLVKLRILMYSGGLSLKYRIKDTIQISGFRWIPSNVIVRGEPDINQGGTRITAILPKSGAFQGDDMVFILFNLDEEVEERMNGRLCSTLERNKDFAAVFHKDQFRSVGRNVSRTIEKIDNHWKRVLDGKGVDRGVITRSRYLLQVMTPPYTPSGTPGADNREEKLVDVTVAFEFISITEVDGFKYKRDHHSQRVEPPRVRVESGAESQNQIREEHESDPEDNALFSSPEYQMSDGAINEVADELPYSFISKELETDLFGANNLFYSVARDDINEVMFLVNKKKFDVNRKDIFGVSPIDVAFCFGSHDCRKFLEGKGALRSRYLEKTEFGDFQKDDTDDIRRNGVGEEVEGTAFRGTLKRRRTGGIDLENFPNDCWGVIVGFFNDFRTFYSFLLTCRSLHLAAQEKIKTIRRGACKLRMNKRQFERVKGLMKYSEPHIFLRSVDIKHDKETNEHIMEPEEDSLTQQLSESISSLSQLLPNLVELKVELVVRSQGGKRYDLKISNFDLLERVYMKDYNYPLSYSCEQRSFSFSNLPGMKELCIEGRGFASDFYSESLQVKKQKGQTVSNFLEDLTNIGSLECLSLSFVEVERGVLQNVLDNRHGILKKLKLFSCVVKKDETLNNLERMEDENFYLKLEVREELETLDIGHVKIEENVTNPPNWIRFEVDGNKTSLHIVKINQNEDPFKSFIFFQNDSTFFRGNVRALHITPESFVGEEFQKQVVRNGLSNLHDLKIISEDVHFKFDTNRHFIKFRDVDRFFSFDNGWDELICLNFQSSEFNIPQIANLTKLESLFIWSSNLVSTSFFGLKNLKEMYLFVPLSEEMVLGDLSLENLEVLFLSFRIVKFKEVVRVEKMPNLRKFVFGCHKRRLMWKSPYMLKSIIINLPSLEELAVSGTEVIVLEQTPKLKRFEVYGNSCNNKFGGICSVSILVGEMNEDFKIRDFRVRRSLMKRSSLVIPYCKNSKLKKKNEFVEDLKFEWKQIGRERVEREYEKKLMVDLSFGGKFGGELLGSYFAKLESLVLDGLIRESLCRMFPNNTIDGRLLPLLKELEITCPTDNEIAHLAHFCDFQGDEDSQNEHISLFRLKELNLEHIRKKKIDYEYSTIYKE